MCKVCSDISEFNPNHMKMMTDTFEIHHYKQPYFKALDFHNHDFYEFYIFLEGSVTYYIEERAYTLCAGDILVIPPGRMHRLVTNKPDAIYERVVLWLNRDFLELIDDGTLQFALSKVEDNRQYLYPIPKSEISYITDTLDRLISANKSQNHLLQIGYLTVILCLLERIVRQVKYAHDVVDEQDIIPQIISYINKHICEKLTLDGLSERFFISKYHLIRRFKAYTNSTVYDYIITKRVVLSKELLRDGTSAVDAANRCGFTDYSNFYKAFHSRTGMTPSEFKPSKTQNR